MKKVLSIMIVAVLLVAGVFLLTGCGEKSCNENVNNSQIKVDGDTKQSNDNKTSSQVIPLENSYDVKLEGNIVSVISNLGGNITTTKYIFENNSIIKIETVQEYSSTTLAKSTYDQMMATPQVTEQYSDVSLNGKVINLTTKPELVEALKAYTMQDFYETQKMTYGVN